MSSRRRDRGQGGLYYDEARGVWVGEVDLGRDGTGRRRRRRVTGRTAAIARGKLAELRSAAESGLPVGPARLTVAELLEDWLGRGLPATVRSPATRENYAWAVRSHLVPRLGGHRVRDLSPDHVHDALTGMAGAGLSGRSLRLGHLTLTRALRWAERRGLVARNVSTLVDTPSGPSRPSRALTVEQATALLAAARGDRLEALLVTGLMTGLRPGELLGLPWGAVDLDAGVIEVRQALTRSGAGLGIGEVKTARSRRRLDAPAPVLAALRAHRTRQAAERLAAGGSWTDSGLVFCSEVGTPIDPSNLRRAFARLTRAAGLGHWHPHELRHSAASILSAAGVPLEQVSDLLGHTGVRITAEVYRHVVTPSIGAARRMEGVFAVGG